MKITVKESRGSLIGDLPSCIGFIDSKDIANVVAGETYEFMITGYTKKCHHNTKLPSAVYLSLVQPGDKLVEVDAFDTSGSMCRTTTYHDSVGMIYPSFNKVCLIVDNTQSSFFKLPYKPRPRQTMWVRKHSDSTHRCMGVDRYEHIGPVLATDPHYMEVCAQHGLFHRVHRFFFNKETVAGLNMSQAMELVRTGKPLPEEILEGVEHQAREREEVEWSLSR